MAYVVAALWGGAFHVAFSKTSHRFFMVFLLSFQAQLLKQGLYRISQNIKRKLWPPQFPFLWKANQPCFCFPNQNDGTFPKIRTPPCVWRYFPPTCWVLKSLLHSHAVSLEPGKTLRKTGQQRPNPIGLGCSPTKNQRPKPLKQETSWYLI